MIAIEDKGILGMDYNRGPTTKFFTSSRNVEVRASDPVHDHTAPGQARHGIDSENATTDAMQKVQPKLPNYQRPPAKLMGLDWKLLFGIVVGGLVVLVVALGLLCNCVRKIGPEKELNLDVESDDEENQDASMETSQDKTDNDSV